MLVQPGAVLALATARSARSHFARLTRRDSGAPGPAERDRGPLCVLNWARKTHTSGVIPRGLLGGLPEEASRAPALPGAFALSGACDATWGAYACPGSAAVVPITSPSWSVGFRGRPRRGRPAWAMRRAS